MLEGIPQGIPFPCLFRIDDFSETSIIRITFSCLVLLDCTLSQQDVEDGYHGAPVIFRLQIL